MKSRGSYLVRHKTTFSTASNQYYIYKHVCVCLYTHTVCSILPIQSYHNPTKAVPQPQWTWSWSTSWETFKPTHIDLFCYHSKTRIAQQSIGYKSFIIEDYCVFAFVFARLYNGLAMTKAILFLHVTKLQRHQFLSSEKYQPIQTRPTSYLESECPLISNQGSQSFVYSVTRVASTQLN